MDGFDLKNQCKINSNTENDTFVGIQCEGGKFSIHFPLGFNISNTEKELRKDILLLLASIKGTTGRKESSIYTDFLENSQLEFPFQSYLALIYDFYNRGYYKEQEIQYNKARRGKIDWNRTLKTQKPFMQECEAYYLEFITKKDAINKNELITLIHEYCVYESFMKLGWLFTDKLPQKPRIKYNYKVFKNTIIEKLQHTFDDKNRELFKNMCAIIDYQGKDGKETDYKFGTNRFEYVWESMIDSVFGINDKQRFFPRTRWKLEEVYENACLEPDSIMILNHNIYVLDAKYYKYGQTKYPGDLPESTSINKQITYGEYVATNRKFDDKFGKSRMVYNAFIMPFDSTDVLWQTEKNIISIGEAVSDWKNGDKEYEHVQGILVDVKMLMHRFLQKETSEIIELAKCIETSYRKNGEKNGCINS